MDAPSKAPPAKMLAPTMKPMAMGAIVPMSPFFGSKAVAYTVYTSPNVITISNTTAFQTPTPSDNENADVSYPTKTTIDFKLKKKLVKRLNYVVVGLHHNLRIIATCNCVLTPVFMYSIQGIIDHFREINES